ncbi:hypothetical protein SAMN05444370_12220 [Rubrimonas cliftonensis]|uniref:Uncharacterized protein n=1 Tax=Rubrimonas cliftonensis TaxID=89524 RepID=A0A1H4FIY3_9RHOB|nr:hypothetical protein SAMN05444370_12220 [Rubrimonas cliftonensis]
MDLQAPGLYPVRILDHEWRARGVHEGDILIVDAAAEPSAGKVSVAFLYGVIADLAEHVIYPEKIYWRISWPTRRRCL